MRWDVAQNRTVAGENICVFPTPGHLSQQITDEMTSVTSLVCGLGLLIHTKLG